MLILVAGVNQDGTGGLGQQMDRRTPAVARMARRIGQDDDRRLEALGTMHRHDADTSASFGQFPADRHLANPHGGEKAKQRGLSRLLVGQREGEELGEHIIHFAAKADVEAP